MKQLPNNLKTTPKWLARLAQFFMLGLVLLCLAFEGHGQQIGNVKKNFPDGAPGVTTQNNRVPKRASSGRRFSRRSRANKMGYLMRPPERRARFLKFFYRDRWQANTTVEKNKKQKRNSWFNRNFKSDNPVEVGKTPKFLAKDYTRFNDKGTTPGNSGPDPDAVGKQSDGSVRRASGPDELATGYKDDGSKRRYKGPDKDATRYKGSETYYVKRTPKEATNNKGELTYYLKRTPKEAVESQGNRTYYAKRTPQEQMEYKGNRTYFAKRTPQEQMEYKGNRTYYAKRTPEEATLFAGRGKYKRRETSAEQTLATFPKYRRAGEQYRPEISGLAGRIMTRRSKRTPSKITKFEGNMEVFRYFDPAEISEYTGNFKPRGKKRTPSSITRFMGNYVGLDPRDNTEFTLWGGDMTPKEEAGFDEYDEWEGNMTWKGKPGQNASALARKQNIKRRTQSTWRNEPGFQMRYVSKPSYSKAEKGLWAE